MRPVIAHVSGPLLHTQLWPPGEAIAVYAVIESPPLALGAFHVIVACAGAVETVTLVGAPASVRGLLVAGALAGEVPMAVVAVAVKV